MTAEQKKRRFRELVKDARIRTASELAKELEQPLLPFNEFQARVSQENPYQGGRWASSSQMTNERRPTQPAQ